MTLEKPNFKKNSCRPVHSVDLYNIAAAFFQVYLFERIMGNAFFFIENLIGIKSLKIPFIGLMLGFNIFLILINLSAFYLAFKEDDEEKRYKYVSGVIANSILILILSTINNYLMSKVI